MARADTVVFDIGGVLLDWDPRHLYRKIFADSRAMERFLGDICTPEWNVAQDAGRPWEEATALLVEKFPDHEANIRAYRDRWLEMVAGPIPGTVAILEQLRQAGVPLYAITNFASDTLRLAQQHWPFLGRFRDVVISGDEKVLKPDRRIFDILVERNGLAREGLVFIDDAEKNVQGAREAGYQAIHFTGPEALGRELKGLGFDLEGA